MRGFLRLPRDPRFPNLAGTAAFLVLVGVTGAGMGFVAVGFQRLLRESNTLFFGRFHQLDLTHTLLDRPYVALAPAAGGLLVGLYLRFVVRRPAGHGVSEVMVAVETRGSRVPWISSVHTAVASAITIGSGGSAGPEGPIIQIGAALASGLGQLFRLNTQRLRILLACGAAAGLAGMYHAPLTGAAFGAEVLLEELEPRSFSLLALSAAAASAVSGQLQSQRIIVLPALSRAPALDVPVDVLLGLLAAPLGVALIIVVHWLGRRTAYGGVPRWLMPAAGGLVVGLLGLVLPRVLGSGETGIEQALGGQLAFTLLLVLPLAKILATSITLGSGATGGVFTPSLFIGATLGGAFGVVVRSVWGDASPVSAYALVGMGTVVAAAVNAPLTAILLVCEFTGDFSLLPEVIVAVAASVVLARRLYPESIYTVPLRAHGIDRAMRRRSPLSRVRVADVMTDAWPTLTAGQTLRQAIALSRSSGRSVFPVLDDGTRYCGLLSLEAVTAALEQAESDDATAAFENRAVVDFALTDVPLAALDDTLHEVALLLGSSVQIIAAVPVVDRNQQYLGVLERTAILRAYSVAARLEQRAARQSGATDAERD